MQEAKRSEEHWKREARAMKQAATSAQAEETRRRIKFMQVRWQLPARRHSSCPLRSIDGPLLSPGCLSRCLSERLLYKSTSFQHM